MHTPSHLILTAALGKAAGDRARIVTGAFLLGSVAPDVPLLLLSLGSGAYYRYGLGWSPEATFRFLFDELYFRDPVWMALHNALHAPLLLAILLGLLWFLGHGRHSWTRWWFWFLAACLLHGVIDVFTHVEDGPLLLFPFEWQTRFRSPVSYWDARHHGRWFACFELALDVALLAYLWGQRAAPKAQASDGARDAPPPSDHRRR